MGERLRPEGLLVVDKPAGITSHDVVARVRRLSGLRRVGHAGTLDPLATGVLLLCLGRATRLVEYLVDQPKTYETRLRLGQSTDTYDADGQLTAEKAVDVDLAALDNALSHFRGAIAQMPPMYSALKRDGQPLYKLARQGKTVAREARQVTIYELKRLRWDAPWLDLRVICSAGTYIRALAHDLGEMLGCGAHVTALRRTAVGRFDVAEAHLLDELAPDTWHRALLPMDATVAHLPRLALTAADARAVVQGRPVTRGPEQPEGLVRAYGADGIFVGILKPRGDQWRAHKVFSGP